MKGRTYQELDLLFLKEVLMREFKVKHIDVDPYVCGVASPACSSGKRVRIRCYKGLLTSSIL